MVLSIFVFGFLILSLGLLFMLAMAAVVAGVIIPTTELKVIPPGITLPLSTGWHTLSLLFELKLLVSRI